MIIQFSRVFLIALLLAVAYHSTAFAVPSAMEQIEATVKEALTVLQEPADKEVEGRIAQREKLRQVIFNRFDFEQMSTGAIGRPWRKFNDSQKNRFIDLFKEVLETAYLDKIVDYQGEVFRFDKEVEESAATRRVDSTVISKGQEFRLSYRMLADGDQWRVFDVIIEGVSLVSNYRSQFNRLLRNESIEALLIKLQEKVAKQKAKEVTEAVNIKP
ncbi:MAG: ABC transporter substrate-binding protein [Magnetococcales bacterium]|nr:ABC transporter substrate-binding protein [Magnetococcales bacterium]